MQTFSYLHVVNRSLMISSGVFGSTVIQSKPLISSCQCFWSKFYETSWY